MKITSFILSVVAIVLAGVSGFGVYQSKEASFGGFRNAQENPSQSVYAVSSVSTSSAAYTLTAANICSNVGLSLVSLSSTQAVRGTVFTLPSTSTMFASCLPVLGKTFSLLIGNGSAATTSQLAAPSGVSLFGAQSGTLASSTISTSGKADSASLFTFLRDTATTYIVKIY